MAKLDKLLDQARGHLDPGEQIEAAVLGIYKTTIMGASAPRNGVLLACPRRLVFYAKRLTGHDLESFPYSSISSFESGKKFTGHHFRFAASGNDVTLEWINQGDVEEFAQIMRARVGQAAAAPTAVVDPMEQLRKLAELRDQGVVTEEEFAAKKAQLLGI